MKPFQANKLSEQTRVELFRYLPDDLFVRFDWTGTPVVFDSQPVFRPNPKVVLQVLNGSRLFGRYTCSVVEDPPTGIRAYVHAIEDLCTVDPSRGVITLRAGRSWLAKLPLANHHPEAVVATFARSLGPDFGWV